MAVAEFGPHAKGVELGDQLERLVVGHPRDADALARRHVERLPAGKGMGADDRVGDVGGLGSCAAVSLGARAVGHPPPHRVAVDCP